MKIKHNFILQQPVAVTTRTDAESRCVCSNIQYYGKFKLKSKRADVMKRERCLYYPMSWALKPMREMVLSALKEGTKEAFEKVLDQRLIALVMVYNKSNWFKNVWNLEGLQDIYDGSISVKTMLNGNSATNYLTN